MALTYLTALNNAFKQFEHVFTCMQTDCKVNVLLEEQNKDITPYGLTHIEYKHAV